MSKRTSSKDLSTDVSQGTSSSKRRCRPSDILGNRMKMYEAEALGKKQADPSLPLIVRIDGHKFSTFTKCFEKPFDLRINSAMTKTMEDLVSKFQAICGYTFSDEITLIFPPCTAEQAPMFNGKLLKVSSVISGYTSVRFAYHLQCVSKSLLTESDDNEKVSKQQLKKNTLARQRIIDPHMHFDARSFNVPSKDEALHNLMWRSLFDCRRNSISSLAQRYYSHRTLQNLGSHELLEKISQKANSNNPEGCVEWKDMPSEYRYGSFCKKEEYMKESYNPKRKEKVVAKRTRVCTKSFKLDGHNSKNVEMIFAKVWPKTF